MWTHSRSLLLTRVVTGIFFALLVIATFSLPELVRGYIAVSGKDPGIFGPLVAVLYACVLPAAVLLVCLFRLLTNLSREQVFIQANITLLRVLSWCCFLAAFLFGAFCFQYVMAILIAVTAAFMGLILRVVKNVFEQAIDLKTENDFTV